MFYSKARMAFMHNSRKTHADGNYGGIRENCDA